MTTHVQLQDRDLGLLIELGAVGLLDTDQIHRRHFNGVTRRRCQQRLKQLQEQGTIKSVSLTVWHGKQGGGQVPTIHCLTERGAELIETMGVASPPRFQRSDPKPETLHHRLAVVQARLAFDDACQLLGLLAPDWIMEQDQRLDAKLNEHPSRHRVLYHEFIARGKKFTCQPDSACRLQIPRDLNNPDAGTTPLLVFWEIDRSTERTSQVLAKCPGYASLLEHQEYLRYWPGYERAAVRIFWVCRSRQRIESLSNAIKSQSIAEYFRFTTADELQPETALTMPIWRVLDGQAREILRLPLQTAPLLKYLSNPTQHLSPHIGP